MLISFAAEHRVHGGLKKSSTRIHRSITSDWILIKAAAQDLKYPWPGFFSSSVLTHLNDTGAQAVVYIINLRELAWSSTLT